MKAFPVKTIFKSVVDLTANHFLSQNSQPEVTHMGETSHGISGETRPMTYQQSSARKRALYLDQIKALVVALVIALHVPMVFSWGWFGIRIPVEESVGPFFAGFFQWYGYAINSFIMYMMFLISGYFVPRSVHKKGIAQYLKDRLLRLGIPFLAGMLLINNISYLIARSSPDSPLAEMPMQEMPFNHVGVLWFLVVLFGFDLLYCAWFVLRGDRFAVDTSIPTPGLRSWLISAVALGIFEVLMTTQTDLWVALLRSPLDALGLQGMHIFTYAFLFFLGCKASFHHWFERLDSHLVMQWFRLSVFLLLSFLSLYLTLSFNTKLVDEPAKITLLGYFFYPCIAWGILSYLILWFQRNEDRFGQWLADAGVNSYGAYVIHTLVLVAVLMALGFIGLNPWILTVIATALTAFISFALTAQLRKIPTVAKFL